MVGLGRFHTQPEDLERLWEKIPDDPEITVVMEPTRNAWVPVGFVAAVCRRTFWLGPPI